MPSQDRQTRFAETIPRSASSISRSPSSRSAGRPASSRGLAARIDAGIVSATSSSREPAPIVSSIRRTSASPGPRWRRTKVSVGLSRAAPVRYAEGSPSVTASAVSGKSLSFSTLHVLLVLLGVHEALEIVRGGEPDLEQPALDLRVLVEQLRVVHHGVVDLDDLARDGRVDLGDGLDGLDGAELVVGVEHLADLRQLDEHHLPQLLLGELGDAEHAHVVLDADPLVLLGIEIISGVHCLFHPPVLTGQLPVIGRRLYHQENRQQKIVSKTASAGAAIE